MKKQNIWLFLILTLFLSCEDLLEQDPQDTTSKAAVFGTEKGLELYSYSLYDWMPSANGITRIDAVSDFAARRDVPFFIRPGAYDEFSEDNTSSSSYDRVALGGDADWGWRDLRNINYMIVNCTDPDISPETNRHYIGLAKYFRAFFYFEKVKRYGEVPWFGKPIDVDDDDLLYGPRDPRTLVMDSVLADLNYAIEHIATAEDNTRSLVTKSVATALKARVCLFEGTFRKYHTELGLEGTANTWLAEAESAAKKIMDDGVFSLYTGKGVDLSYREVFTSNKPVAAEVLQAIIQDEALGETHSSNWRYTAPTTGVRFSFIRTFINTYLMLDGTSFTDRAGYETMLFRDEVKGRDKRLQQTIRLGDYTRTSGGQQLKTPTDFGYSYTGYQPIKWCLDDVEIDTRDLNTNSICTFRFGEVLLNYAEAKAEMGTLTDADWAMTIGTLRARAGITGGLDTRPTVVDPYLQANYFPAISDPVILEIRRERGIELAMEGFRFYDLVRWKKGKLMEMVWNGMYVPLLDTPMDLNEDGVDDVRFYKDTKPASIPGVIDLNVSAASSEMLLKNDTYGEITWLTNVEKAWDENKHYYYPIPNEHRILNPALGQNPGW